MRGQFLSKLGFANVNYSHKDIEVSFIPEDKNYKIKELIKMYFISILWRASVTERKEFSQVNLGDKYESKAREAILNQNSEFFPELDIVFSKFEHGISGFMLPRKEKFGVVNGYRIGFPYYSCLVKVDRRPFPLELDGLSLNTSDKVGFNYRIGANAN
ncbi:hypothetical protein ACD661_15760 [Legionella lytica]|uniref:Uncharacterized protein n=1 Tax=Legionella lytica TaxID=96232 RepID=A0ABW8DFJ9_9GAMM